MKSKFADRGKDAEKEAHDWLEARSASDLRFAYHRLPDSRSARNPLPAQPSDFIVSQDGAAGFRGYLEVKETENLTRLPKDKISQYGKLRMFYFAGMDVAVLVRRSAHNDWVWFDGGYLFLQEIAPKSFSFEGLTSYPTAAAALKVIFP